MFFINFLFNFLLKYFKPKAKTVLIANRFKFLKEIGRGAEGTVMAVEDTKENPNKREMLE